MPEIHGEMPFASCNLFDMERICSQCHAVLAEESQAKVCPACGEALVERPRIQGADSEQEIDHRGIVLPRRHSLGGIITPQ